MAASDGPIVIGTSGFSFKDWVGPFYPPGTKPGDMLRLYAERFPAVEVNSTYYRIPHPRVMLHLDEKTPPGFEFLVKAHKSMTHAKADPDDATYREFRASIAPLVDAEKFHGVLLQFPHSFRPNRGARRRLEGLRVGLGEGTPLFVEFRNEAWLTEPVFQFLEEHAMGYCSVDEPSLPGLVPPVARLTSDVGYVRLHGRNATTWWGRDPGKRYDYLYRSEELSDWVAKIRDLAARASKVYVFFNNCHAGQAARNALMMREMMHGPSLAGPPR